MKKKDWEKVEGRGVEEIKSRCDVDGIATGPRYSCLFFTLVLVNGESHDVLAEEAMMREPTYQFHYDVRRVLGNDSLGCPGQGYVNGGKAE